MKYVVYYRKRELKTVAPILETTIYANTLREMYDAFLKKHPNCVIKDYVPYMENLRR